MNLSLRILFLLFLSLDFINAETPASDGDVLAICKSFDSLGRKTSLKFVLELQLNDETAQDLSHNLQLCLDEIDSGKGPTNAQDVIHWLILAHFKAVSTSPSGTVFGTMCDKTSVCSSPMVTIDELTNDMTNGFSKLKPGIALDSSAKDVLPYLGNRTTFDYSCSNLNGVQCQLTDPDVRVKSPPETLFQLLDTFVATQKHGNLLAVCVFQPKQKIHVTVFVQGN